MMAAKVASELTNYGAVAAGESFDAFVNDVIKEVDR